jgi:hypothetical protein
MVLDETTQGGSKKVYRTDPRFSDYSGALSATMELLKLYGHLLLQANSPMHRHMALKIRELAHPALALIPMLTMAVNNCSDALTLLDQLTQSLENSMDAYYELPVDVLFYDLAPNLDLLLACMRTGLKKTSLLLPPGKFCKKNIDAYAPGNKDKVELFDPLDWTEITWPKRPVGLGPRSRANYVQFIPPDPKRVRTPYTPSGSRFRGGGCCSYMFFNGCGHNRAWRRHVKGCQSHFNEFKTVMGKEVSKLDPTHALYGHVR